jgi:hypothetical protein
LFNVTKNGDTILTVYKVEKAASTPLEYDHIQIPSDLPVARAAMSEDNKNIYVYTLVVYQGAPTIQQYTIPLFNQ